METTEDTGQGHPGGDLVQPKWYEFTFAQRCGDRITGHNGRVEGGSKAVAAFMRALADEIDPPVPPPTADPGEGTFPAQGLRTDRRVTSDHRDFKTSRRTSGFGPVSA